MKVILVVALVAASVWWRDADASIVMAVELPQLVSRAERIVLVEVGSAQSRWTRNRESITTEVELKVIEIWKGEALSTKTVTVSQPGGVVDGMGLHVHGMPDFVRGERAVMFLRPARRGASTFSVVGMSQGKRGVWRDEKSGTWMVEGRSDAAETVVPDGLGGLRAAPSDGARALDSFRTLVQSLAVTP